MNYRPCPRRNTNLQFTSVRYATTWKMHIITHAFRQRVLGKSIAMQDQHLIFVHSKSVQIKESSRRGRLQKGGKRVQKGSLEARVVPSRQTFAFLVLLLFSFFLCSKICNIWE